MFLGMHLRKIIICQMLAIALLAVCAVYFSAGTGGSAGGRWRKSGKKSTNSKIIVLSETNSTRKIQHYVSGVAGSKSVVVHVPLKPKRVIAFSCADYMYFLGLSPVAEAGSWDFYPKRNYIKPYNDANSTGHVGGVYGSRMPDAESTMTFNPDLVIMQGWSAYSYPVINKVAPTVLLPSYKNRKIELHLIDIGKILGCQDKAIRASVWFAKKNYLVKKALDKYYPKGAKVSVLWFTSKRIRVCNKHYIFQRLGLKPVTQIPWVGVHPVGSGIYYMDVEQLAGLDAEHIFAVSLVSRKQFSAGIVENLPIWKTIPAVKNNKVTKVNVGHWISGGPLGRSIMLNELINAMLTPKQISPELKSMIKDRPSKEDLLKLTQDEIQFYLDMISADCQSKETKKVCSEK